MHVQRIISELYQMHDALTPASISSLTFNHSLHLISSSLVFGATGSGTRQNWLILSLEI